tara:strand:- start:45 stop:431 length:387 start_codon:yes stop_codon:yes gene_type:complete
MKLYHALPQKYLDIQLDELGFTIKHPVFKRHSDITPAMWATKVPYWSYTASVDNEWGDEDVVVIEIDTTDAPDIEVTNQKDFVVPNRDYYLIRTSTHIPLNRIRILDEYENYSCHPAEVRDYFMKDTA